MNEKLIEQAVSNAITETPIEITIGEETFHISPPTLGKLQVLSKYYLMLDIDEAKLEESPITEMFNICQSKTDIVTELMAVATFDKREDILNNAKIKERAELFKWAGTSDDFAQIVISILSQSRCENFTSSIRLMQTLRQNEPKVGS